MRDWIFGSVFGLGLLMLGTACTESSGGSTSATAGASTTGGGGGGSTSTTSAQGGAGGDGGSATGGAAITGGVVFGVTLGSDFYDYATVAKARILVNGADFSEEAFQLKDLPAAYSALNVPEGADVELQVTIWPSPNYPGNPPTTRVARTKVTGERTVLYRTRLSLYCLPWYYPALIASCEASGAACSESHCVDPYVPSEALEEYTADWASFSYCKPHGYGPSEMTLGKGSSELKPIEDLETIPVVQGPQGGYHIWIAARMKNLRQQPLIELTADFEDPTVDHNAGFVQFFVEDYAQGDCVVTGMPFLLAGPNPADILGKTAILTATITDDDGDSATASKTITIADMPCTSADCQY